MQVGYWTGSQMQGCPALQGVSLFCVMDSPEQTPVSVQSPPPSSEHFAGLTTTGHWPYGNASMAIRPSPGKGMFLILSSLNDRLTQAKPCPRSVLKAEHLMLIELSFWFKGKALRTQRFVSLVMTATNLIPCKTDGGAQCISRPHLIKRNCEDLLLIFFLTFFLILSRHLNHVNVNLKVFPPAPPMARHSSREHTHATGSLFITVLLQNRKGWAHTVHSSVPICVYSAHQFRRAVLQKQ